MKLSNANTDPQTLEYRNNLITLDEARNLDNMVRNFAHDVQVMQKHIRYEQRLTSAKAHSDMGSVWMSDNPSLINSAIYATNNPEGLRGVEQLTAYMVRRHTVYHPWHVTTMARHLGTFSVGFVYKGNNITYQKQVPVRMHTMMHAITNFLLTDDIIQGKAQLFGARLDVVWRNTRGFRSGLGYGFDFMVLPAIGTSRALSSAQEEAITAFQQYIQLQVQRKLRLAIEKLRLHMDPSLYKRPMRIKGEDE